jgi:uncharacterized protein (DUF983 family)
MVAIEQSVPRSWKQAVLRGLACHCPACGKGRVFKGFMKVSERCEACGEELHHHRADDAPPYFTIFIVGHIVIPLVLITEKLWQPPLAVHFGLWVPLTLGLTLVLMQPIKAAIVALQWAFKMHGFEYAAGLKRIP